jgi:hypothetical protein
LLAGSLDRSAELRRRTVLYLSWRSDGWVPTVLRALCEDDEPLVSWPALRALSELDPTAVSSLLEQPRAAPFPGYRRLLARILRALAEQERQARQPKPAAESSSQRPKTIATKSERSSIWPAAPALPRPGVGAPPHDRAAERPSVAPSAPPKSGTLGVPGALPTRDQVEGHDIERRAAAPRPEGAASAARRPSTEGQPG